MRHVLQATATDAPVARAERMLIARDAAVDLPEPPAANADEYSTRDDGLLKDTEEPVTDTDGFARGEKCR